MLRRYLHAIQGTYVRIARIQVDSPLRDQALYPDHYYEISVRLNSIYAPEKSNYYKPQILRIYASASKRHYYTNSTVFYTKTTTDDDITYIDVAVAKNSFSTSIDVKIDTADEGSVTLMQDMISGTDINSYGRIDCQNVGYRFDSKNTIWLTAGSNYSINTTKAMIKVIALSSGNTAYVFDDQKINYDNNSMTVTVDATDTYFNRITVTPKVQGWFVIEA